MTIIYLNNYLKLLLVDLPVNNIDDKVDCKINHEGWSYFHEDVLGKLLVPGYLNTNNIYSCFLYSTLNSNKIFLFYLLLCLN